MVYIIFRVNIKKTNGHNIIQREILKERKSWGLMSLIFISDSLCSSLGCLVNIWVWLVVSKSQLSCSKSIPWERFRDSFSTGFLN